MFTTADIDWFAEKHLWPGLKSFVLIERALEQNRRIKREARTYISSPDARRAPRGHRARPRGVENGLHWMLDVAFHEDQSLVRRTMRPHLSLLRKLALMLVRREKTHKRGVATKRKRAAWDPYHLKLLGAALHQ